MAPELPQARVVDVPGGEFATVMHVGQYEELGLAYHVRPEALQTEVLLPL